MTRELDFLFRLWPRAHLTHGLYVAGAGTRVRASAVKRGDTGGGAAGVGGR